MNAPCESFAVIPREVDRPLPAMYDAADLANVEMLANALDCQAAAAITRQRSSCSAAWLMTRRWADRSVRHVHAVRG